MIPFFVLFLLHNHDFHLLNTKHRQRPLSLFEGCGTNSRKGWCYSSSLCSLFARFFVDWFFGWEGLNCMKVTVASNRFYSTQICMPCIIEKVHHWKEYTVKLSEGGITIIPWTQCANAPFSSLTLDAWCYITISWRDNAQSYSLLKWATEWIFEA